MGLIINPRQIIKDGITSLRDVWSSSKVSTELSGKQATLVSGTNIKTINNTSLLGSGDITISGGGDIPRIDMTATTATLEPNKFYVWGEMASLDISLAPEIDGIENVYKFQFQSGTTATTLSLPADVKWSDNTLPKSTLFSTYIVTIQSNIAKIDYYDKLSVMPSGYQQVEWIGSTGTQYINTGIAADGRLHIEIDLKANVGNPWSFGSRYAFNVRAFIFGTGGSYGSSAVQTFLNYSTSYSIEDAAYLNDGLRHTYTIDNGTFKQEERIVYSFPPENFSNEFGIYLFATNQNGGVLGLCSYNMYRCTFILNDVTIANLVPCYRKADNVAGLYDMVNDVFLTNSGTGSFLLGPDV